MIRLPETARSAQRKFVGAWERNAPIRRWAVRPVPGRKQDRVKGLSVIGASVPGHRFSRLAALGCFSVEGLSAQDFGASRSASQDVGV